MHSRLRNQCRQQELIPFQAVLQSIVLREQRREKREDRTTVTLFAISAAYIICIFPPAVLLAVGE